MDRLRNYFVTLKGINIREEDGKEAMALAAGLMLLGWVCFHHIAGCVCMLVFWPLAVGYRKKQKQHQRSLALQKEFRSAMASLYSFTAAGSTLEKAIRDTYREMKKLEKQYPLLIHEFEKMCISMDRNMRADQVLLDFAEKTQEQEILQFAQILSIAGKSGGALSEIVRSTADAMSLRMEINEEVETMLSGRRGELMVMMVVPVAILIYMNLCSPDYMAALYNTLVGRVTVLISIAVYLVAARLGQRILDIQV